MRETIDVLKALADESRVRVLMALRGRELCVCRIVALLGLAPSTVSKHMSILKRARLVESRKDGRWIYYRGVDKDSPQHARAAVKMLTRQLEHDKRIQEDDESLERILRVDPEELCRRQARG